MKVFRAGVGQISVPKLGQAQRVAGFRGQGLADFPAQGMVGFCIEFCCGTIAFYPVTYITFNKTLISLVSQVFY